MTPTHTEITAIADIVAREVSDRIAASMLPGRWLTMQEAQAYAKVRSIDTIKKWVREGLIYGRPRSGRGDWIIDRNSIDRFYLEERVEIS
jgi:hypothetical protein